MAERFVTEKAELVRTLRQHGCYAAHTPPRQLPPHTTNQCLELKVKGVA